MLGDAGGMALELALGGGSGARGAQAAGLGGVYFGVYFLDVGYSYQLPLGPFDRPGWLASHSLSIRVHAPVARHDVKEWETSTTARTAPSAAAP
jgi:hypothetical protein